MSRTSKEVIKKYPHFRYHHREVMPKDHAIEVKDDGSVLHQIFAPDPTFGVPNSDLALMMSRDTSPEVSQFIRDNLMKPIPSMNCGEDSDFALESVKSSFESDEAYYERLRHLCAPQQKESDFNVK